MPQLEAKTIVVTQITLVDLNAEIERRRVYQKEQETIIEQIVNDGNNRLLDLNFQINVAKIELKEKKAKLYELARETFQAEEDLRELKAEIERTYEKGGALPSFGV